MAGNFEFNPWLTIFTKPRMTIKAIVEFNPNFRLLWLAGIYGFCSLLGIVQNFGMGENQRLIFTIWPILLLAPLWGYLLFSFSSFFVFIAGKLLKGQGSFKAVRAAYAWSNVPLIVNVFLWVLLISVFGFGLFSESVLRGMLTPASSFFLMGVIFAQLVFSVWSLILYIISLAEVQQFSILRTLVNVFLAFLFFFTIALRLAYRVFILPGSGQLMRFQITCLIGAIRTR